MVRFAGKVAPAWRYAVAAARPVTTNRQIASLRPAAAGYERLIPDSPGLRVRVFPSGSRQFEFRYTALNGSRRRLVLGSYPDLTLSHARARAAENRVLVKQGGDPVADRAAAREQARIGQTLDELAEAYWDAAKVGLHGGRKRPKREVTLANERQLWRNHIQKPLGGRLFTAIRRADVKVFMRGLVNSGLSASSVASVGGVLQAVLGFAVLEERLDSNPAAGLARPLALTSRERMFNDEALWGIWTAAEQASEARQPGEKTAGVHARLEPPMGLAIQLLMLTLTRRNEVAGALKAEFDRTGGLWTIPSARAKAKHQHVVPLDQACLAVVEKAWALDPDSPYLFPSLRQPEQHIDPHAITRAFARTCRRKGLQSGSPHDVRRSGATTLTGRYDVTRFTVGLVLGHTPNGGAAVTGVYDRHTYVPEKREALRLWSCHLRRATFDQAGASAAAPPPAARHAESIGPHNSHADDFASAQAQALELCAGGALHDAVVTLVLALGRQPGLAAAHQSALARAGLALANAGSQSGVAEWARGLR